MTTFLGITLNCILVCYEDEEEEELIEYNRTTFYEITTTYSVDEGVYGKGTILVSGGFEYFCKLSDQEIQKLIIKTKTLEAQQNLTMFIN